MPESLKNIVKQAFLFARDIVAPFWQFEEVSILCYHSIELKSSEFTTTAAQFDAHLSALKRWGSIFVSLRDIEEWQTGKRVLPRRAVALTFDDGYEDFETQALPLLKKYNAPAALFVLGDSVKADWDPGRNRFLSADAIERLRGEPLLEIGYHSLTHPMLETLALGDLVQEIKRPRGERYFAYPGGHYSANVVDAVKAEGYSAAYSIKPTLVTKQSDPYLMPRNVITKNTKPWELRFATTKAVAWYRALWRLFV